MTTEEEITLIESALDDVVAGDFTGDRNRVGAEIFERLSRLVEQRPDGYLDRITAAVNKLLVEVFRMPAEEVDDLAVQKFVNKGAANADR